MLPVDEQMKKLITSGAAQIVPEADLRKKLEKGTPLNIKLGVGHYLPRPAPGSCRSAAQDAPVPGFGPQRYPHHRQRYRARSAILRARIQRVRSCRKSRFEANAETYVYFRR